VTDEIKTDEAATETVETVAGTTDQPEGAERIGAKVEDAKEIDGRGGHRPGSGRKPKPPSPFEAVETAAEHVRKNAPDAEAEAMRRDKAKRTADEKEAAKAKGKKAPASRISTPDVSDKEAARLERCRMAGRQAADSLVLLMQAFMGPEWAYRQDVEIEGNTVSERDQLREAYAETFVYYGWEPKADWMTMAMATGAYVAPRLSMPETKARVQTLREKVVAWWMNRSATKQSKQEARIRELEAIAARAEKAGVV
jgi:hypothetical protein